MVKIIHTNVIVDQFSTARSNPFNKYIHFLTHIHTDHLKGLSNSWDYGPIYCSSITKKLIMLKYPRLKCLRQLQLEKQYTIALSSQLQITVTLFDANHCAGGVMLLFQGYMGTVLYTGDMRFDREVFSQYSYLYPHVKRNKQFKHCSLNVDFLYLDTTFLHPKFNFPPKPQALQQLDNYIETTINKAKQQKKFIEFYIGIDSFGKEEVLVHLAEKFQTLITVSEERYRNIQLIGLDSELFTTDPQAGFIHIVLKRQLNQYVIGKQNTMGIILTGWANQSHYRSSRTYAIPYSLHSSYPELVQFVDSIRPCYIDSILEVSLSAGQKGCDNPQKSWSDGARDRKVEKDQSQRYSDGALKLKSQYRSPINNNYNKNDFQLYQQINTTQYLNTLRKQFTSKPSSQLTFLMNNIQFQATIKKKLKLDKNSIEINKEELALTVGNNIARVENINRAGAKLNNQRNQQEIERIKMKLKNKKESTIKYTLNEYSSKVSSRNSNKMVQDSQTNNKSQNDIIGDEEKQNYRKVQNKKEKTDDKDKLSVNINNTSNNPLELQDYVQEWIQQQMNKSRDINNSGEGLSSQGNQNNHVSHSSGKESSSNKSSKYKEQRIEGDNQVTKRNKWRQKLQEGEIDLFGQININKKHISIHTSSNNNSNNNSERTNNIKRTNNDNKSNSSSLRSKQAFNTLRHLPTQNNKTKKYIQHENIIQLISSSDEDDDNQTNKRTISIQSSNSSSMRKKCNGNSSSNGSSQCQLGVNKEETIVLPIERQPNQRSIVQFFTKRQQHNDKVISQRIQNQQHNTNTNTNTVNSQLSQLIQDSNGNKASQLLLDNNKTSQQQQQEQQEQEQHSQQQQQLERTQSIRYSYQTQIINQNQQQNQLQQSQQQLQKQDSQQRLDDFDQENQQLQKGIYTLKHCSQVSILSIDTHHLDKINEASSNNYKNFFMTNYYH